MAGVFASSSRVTPLTRNSSYKTSFNSPLTLLPSFALFSARKCSWISLSLLCKCNSTSICTPKPSREPVISEGRDEDLTRLMCPGCGVFMQDSDPNLPGYYKKPPTKDKNSFADADGVHMANSDEFSEIEDELVNEFSEESDSDEEMESFSDFVEIDLGSDWEDNRTLKNKVEGELASASSEKNDSDKETIELSDLDQMGNGGFEQDSNFKEAEILEAEMDKNIWKKSKGSKKPSSKKKSRFKSSGKICSSLDQFLEEEESEDGSFSNSDVDEEFE